jgi:ubiquinol-cytochrome c reductase cytochrome b subunit
VTVKLFDWLDARTNYRAWLGPIRRRVLPSGPSWWYSVAACLLWLFIIQMVTGLLLMTTYCPSTAGAWASVHFIDQSSAGAFLRGVHHFASHALIVLFGVHVIRVVLAGAFRGPRDLIWITGLLLIPLMMVWAMSGNPLSAGQKGMAQIEVEGNIIGSTPIIGPIIQRILIGGQEVGQLTLTHLYFLHVGLLPLLVIGLLAIHIGQVYRHGLMALPRNANRLAVPYWPYQSVRNMTAVAIVVGIVAVAAWWRGAPLDAPADAALPHTPRPEWYFRWLFELRRFFTGDWEFVATMVIPTAVLLFFVSLPAIDRICPGRRSIWFRVAVVLVCGIGWGWLTGASYVRDQQDEQFQNAETASAELAERARQLANGCEIPPAGAVTLLRDDPQTQGPILFSRHCASCHSHVDQAGQGIAAAEPSAPNLEGFGTPSWILGMLTPKQIVSAHYFGKTAFADGEMVGKVNELFADVEGEKLDELQSQLTLVARALSAEAGLTSQKEADARDAQKIAQGKDLIAGALSCTDCHRFHESGELGSAPDLTDYGSRSWLRAMIGDPQGPRFYPAEKNDRMPAFAKDAAHPDHNLLTVRELDLLVAWLRGEWYQAPSADLPAASPVPRRDLALKKD